MNDTSTNVGVSDDNALRQDQQYLTFVLSGETFAIPILGVKEIIEYEHVTNVPLMPAFIRGVINLRGSVVPVVDLAVRFGRNSAATSKRTCIVILEAHKNADGQDIGVVVDQVNAVLDILPSDIEPPPAFGTRIRADYIRGMAKIRERFVIVLDVDRVLSIDELAELSVFGRRELADLDAATDSDILIVDDSESVRTALTLVLESAGFGVRTAADGVEAMAAIGARLPAAVVSDLEMPNMNGLELTARLRAGASTRSLPVVMVTSRTTDRHRSDAQAAGVNEYITKPFDHDDLVKRLRTLLRRAA